jgi:uncharacterized protein (DUF608 family)
MPRPKPDPETAAKRDREQARSRMQDLRDNVKKRGGENISGVIEESEAADLEAILEWQRKSNPKASKIGAIRWAIRFAASILRKEGKIK